MSARVMPSVDDSASRASTKKQNSSLRRSNSFKKVGAHMLSKLKVGTTGSFGSIRFGHGDPRAAPSKFIRISPEAEVCDVIELLLETWKILPPCAMLSCAHSDPIRSGKGDAVQQEKDATLQSVLRRGIAEATHKSKAWIFSSGDAKDVGAVVGGGASMYGRNELDGYHGRPWTSPCIGIAPWAELRDREALENLPLGAIHRSVEPSSSTKSMLKSVWSAARGTPRRQSDEKKGSARGADEPSGTIDLECHHTHFLLGACLRPGAPTRPHGCLCPQC